MSDTTTVEHLPCKLTGPETLLKSAELAKKLGELGDIEAAKAAATSQYGGQIKKKKAEIAVIAHEVRSGEEMRPVECFERPRYADMMVDKIRTDTGLVVSTRPMHPSERQKALDFHKPPKKTAVREAEELLDDASKQKPKPKPRMRKAKPTNDQAEHEDAH